jgi:hypothetical protein
MNEELRNHVTRVGFNLTLSLSQIASLIVLEKETREQTMNWSQRKVERNLPWANAINSRWVIGIQGCERRGLVVHHWVDARTKPSNWKPTIDKYYSITAAGKHVIGLLKEAGIYQEIEPTIVLTPLPNFEAS